VAGGAAPAAQAPRRLGLALAVIATAQLMVVLDLTIVTVALPHIQTALGFSGSNLEWVVNAYAVAFGGLLLLGGLATDQAWLITARAHRAIADRRHLPRKARRATARRRCTRRWPSWASWPG